MKSLVKGFPSFALATVLAAGAFVAWVVVAACIMTMCEQWMPFDSFEDLFILNTGEPAIDTHRTDEEGGIIRALDGTRLKISERWQHAAANSDLPALEQQEGDRHLPSWDRRLRNLEGPPHYPVVWYFLHDGEHQGHGCLVGYDTRSKLAIGYIGRNGFTADAPAPDDQFSIKGDRIMTPFGPLLQSNFCGDWPYPLHPGITPADAEDMFQPWTIHLLADDGLVRINVKERTARYLRKDSHILSAAMVAPNMPPPVESIGQGRPALPRNSILLRTSDHIEQINLRGKSLKTYPLPLELRGQNLQWHELPDGNALVRTGHGAGIWNNELFWIDNNGKIVRHEKIELNRETGRSEIIGYIGTFVLGICPGLLTGIMLTAPSEFPISRSLDYFAALVQAFTDLWPILAIVIVIACVLALLCFRRQRKYGQPNAWGWAAFVLLLGVPGYLGYLAHRAWPTRLPCPHCGKPAPRDRPACFTCGRDFPPPAPKGIEVFA